MLMKKIASLMVAVMFFVTGVGLYQAATPTPEIVAEAGQFGLSASMNDDGTISFGNKDFKVTDQKDVWNQVLGVLQTVIQAIGGIGTSLMILFFIMNFIKLGQNSANASEVAKIKTAMLWNGVAAAGLGSVTLIFSLFFSLLKP